MFCGKEARLLLSSLLLGAVSLGCVGLGYHPLDWQTRAPHANAIAPARSPADTEPVPELRIPGSAPQAPPAKNGPAEPIVLATPTPRPDPAPSPTATMPPLAIAAAQLEPPALPDATTRLRLLHEEAAANYARIDSYIVRLRRREQVNGQDKPEEILLFKFRKQPLSVYFKWLGAEGKGREVAYVQGRYEDKIHTLLAAGDVPFVAGGRRFAVAPDSPFVRSNSRHSIQEAGIGILIDHFGQLLAANERGGPGRGSLHYLGPLKRQELAAPCEGVEQTIVAGSDPQLPRGGRRLWGFDPMSKFPVLVITRNEAGHEVEYYCYDRFQYPVKLDDDDFNPEKLWPAKNDRQSRKWRPPSSEISGQRSVAAVKSQV